VFVQDSPEAARSQWRSVADQLRGKFSKLGALMDEISILLITYPILYHIFVRNFGFDSIWFALVFVVTLEVGLVAPPVGINLFVVQGIDRTAKFGEVVKGILPFVFLMIASIFIFIFFKPLATWLPGFVG